MTKIYLGLLFLLFSISSCFAIDKAASEKFADLDYKQGTTLLFFDTEGLESTEINEYTIIERKVFQKNGTYVVADYDLEQDRVLFFETLVDPQGPNHYPLSGLRVTYHKNGEVSSISEYKEDILQGEYVYYQEDGEIIK